MSEQKWTEEMVTTLVMDPERIAEVGREMWVKANLRLINERGPEWWLNTFAAGWDETLDLDALGGPTGGQA